MAQTVADRPVERLIGELIRFSACPAEVKFDGQPVFIEALIEANEPPMPGKISTDPALKFAEAMLRGDKSGWKIITTVMKDRIREVS